MFNRSIYCLLPFIKICVQLGLPVYTLIQLVVLFLVPRCNVKMIDVISTLPPPMWEIL